jgi:hypothetical protein
MGYIIKSYNDKLEFAYSGKNDVDTIIHLFIRMVYVFCYFLQTVGTRLIIKIVD